MHRGAALAAMSYLSCKYNGWFFFWFKYRFGPQPLAIVLNWSLTFQLCQIGPQLFNFVSKWSLSLSIGWKMLTWLTIIFWSISIVIS